MSISSRVAGLSLKTEEKLELVDVSWISQGVSFVVDRPAWLAREGLLTLSLFKNEFRAFTVSFSFLELPNGEVGLFIGGIQGRHREGILDLYRDITKDFQGVRPRDLTLEILRLFAAKCGVEHIFAVADAHKISRHPYFGSRPAPGLMYDEIWIDRGGVRLADTHFELPIREARRDLQEISSKKRSMYRKRYEMLDEIAAVIPPHLHRAKRKQFEAS